MNRTKIEWTTMTWNPASGCRNGCEYCYARAMYQRFGRSFEPQFHPDRLDQPKRRRKPTFIFVCSVADLFGSWVPKEWVDDVLDVIRACPQHTFMLLTKCPQRLPEFSYPENCWVGGAATDQAMADRAMKYLPETDAPIKFLSCEPLLAPVIPPEPVDWLIVGGCSHPKPQQPEKAWVLDLLGWADEYDVPVFMKDNLTVVPPVRRERPAPQGSLFLG